MTIGGCFGLDRAEFGDGDLEVGQDLQQVGLERLVGAVELVDQQHRRPAESASSACSSGRLIRKRSGKMSLPRRFAVDRRPPRPAGSRASARG